MDNVKRQGKTESKHMHSRLYSTVANWNSGTLTFKAQTHSLFHLPWRHNCTQCSFRAPSRTHNSCYGKSSRSFHRYTPCPINQQLVCKPINPQDLLTMWVLSSWLYSSGSLLEAAWNILLQSYKDKLLGECCQYSFALIIHNHGKIFPIFIT